MRVFFYCCYAVYLFFCLFAFVLHLGTAHEAELNIVLFLLFTFLALQPYLYYLFIFKIPVDFAIYCDKNHLNINDFITFFKQNYKYYFLSIILAIISIYFMDITSLILLLPFVWLYILIFKKMLLFIFKKIFDLLKNI